MSDDVVIKYEPNLQSTGISSNTALSFAKQSLIYDIRPDQKKISEKIPKCFWFHPLILPNFFQKMGKQSDRL